MFKEKVSKKPKQTCIPLALTYNRFCPNISKVIRKHWNLLEIKVTKKRNTETENRQILTMPDKFKGTLLQASSKNNYF